MLLLEPGELDRHGPLVERLAQRLAVAEGAVERPGEGPRGGVADVDEHAEAPPPRYPLHPLATRRPPQPVWKRYAPDGVYQRESQSAAPPSVSVRCSAAGTGFAGSKAGKKWGGSI